MLTQPVYKTHNHVKLLFNYHFVWIHKRMKQVLTGEIATRTRQSLAEIAIEKGWDILALEVAPDTRHSGLKNRAYRRHSLRLAAALRPGVVLKAGTRRSGLFEKTAPSAATF